LEQDKPQYPAKLLLATLYEKQSQASGTRFFVGRLGNLGLVMFKGKANPGEEDNIWHLYIQERPKDDSTRKTLPPQMMGLASGGATPGTMYQRGASRQLPPEPQAFDQFGWPDNIT
jgi:hypothetical protein